jgi:oligopeptidase B
MSRPLHARSSRLVYNLGMLHRLVLMLFAATIIGIADEPQPPVARVVPRETTNFGHTRIDNYFWMRERENPEVMAYVKAENAFADSWFKPIDPLVKRIYDEIIGRIKQTDLSAPYRHGPYFYYSRTVEGLQYPIFCRKKGSLDAPEQVTFDVNEMAKGKKFLSMGFVMPDPAHKLYLFATDETGYREYNLRVKDMSTGKVLPDLIERIGFGAAWASDGKHFFYTKEQPKTKRSFQVWRHELGTPETRDQLVYEEKDERFFAAVYRSRSGGFIVIESRSGRSSEARVLDAAKPLGAFTVVVPRQEDITYSVDHHSDSFYLRINDAGRNFRVVRAPVRSPSDRSLWKEVIAPGNDIYVQGMLLLRGYALYLLRLSGLHQIRVVDLASGRSHDIDFDEQAYVLSFGSNPEFDTDVLRYNYSSMVTPQSVFDYDLGRRIRVLVKQQEVLGGYNPSQYAVERVMVPSHDGVNVPMTITYKKGFRKTGKSPVLLYGYGAYSAPTDPYFNPARLSLLDRGFAYAMAHIRGGSDLGYSWYEDGKLLKKKNTFRDFLACAEYLVKQRYTSPERLAIEGGSAGGLLVGAAVTQRPELFRTVLAHVPFVDVVNSLLDDTIPLTTTDADEFGSPKKQEYYEYMMGYSPYDNTRPAKYPDIFIFSSMNDSQVPYWEPLKWTAKLRAMNEGDSRIVLRMNVDAGHGGASGRYDRWKEAAQAYAFLLHSMGIDK